MEEEAQKREAAVRLMTQPGVGPVASLGWVLAREVVERFQNRQKLVGIWG